MAYVYKRADGLWHWRVNRTIDGKRKPINSKIGYRLRSAAKGAADQTELKLKTGDYHDEEIEKLSFAEYYLKWYQTYYEGKQSYATDIHYKNAYQVIQNYFKNKTIQEISRADYQEMLNKFGRTHAPETVAKRHAYISKCFKEAYHDGLISKDPTWHVKLTGDTELAKGEDVKFMNLNDFKALIQLAESKITWQFPSNLMIVVMAGSGLRYEEAAGLTWDRVDYENNNLIINRAWSEHADHGKPGFGPTKNKNSNRTVKIATRVTNLLKVVHAQQLTHLSTSKHFTNSRNLVFAALHDRPITNAALNNQIKKLCYSLGIIKKDSAGKYIKPYASHSLRHTHASTLLYNHLDVAYVSRRLGHQNIMTTYNVYTHVIQEARAREDNMVEKTTDSLFEKKSN